MNQSFASILVIALLCSCSNEKEKQEPARLSAVSVEGTWQLVSGTTISKSDTVFTDYTKDQEMIKIINATHFSFLKHDRKKGKDSAAVYDSGGGSYTLVNDQYTEHLQYCNEREWEGHDFQFTVAVKNDTLVQQGLEKVEGTGVDRIIIEKYARIKN
jgi:hypothetical protein